MYSQDHGETGAPFVAENDQPRYGFDAAGKLIAVLMPASPVSAWHFEYEVNEAA